MKYMAYALAETLQVRLSILALRTVLVHGLGPVVSGKVLAALTSSECETEAYPACKAHERCDLAEATMCHWPRIRSTAGLRSLTAVTFR